MKVVLIPLFVASTVILLTDAARPTGLRRNGLCLALGTPQSSFQPAASSRAPRITEEDGGYVDIARSKDGRATLGSAAVGRRLN